MILSATTAKAAKKYPGKETINLAMRDGPKRNTRMVLLVTLLLALCVCAFGKFCILDPMLQASQAEAMATTDEQLLTDMRAALSDYDTVQEEYDSYRLEYSAMNGSLVGTMDGMALVEKYLLPASAVETFAVSGDVITVKLSGVTLNQISDIYNALRDDKQIQSVELYTAATTGERNETTTATMTIFLPSVAAAEGGPTA